MRTIYSIKGRKCKNCEKAKNQYPDASYIELLEEAIKKIFPNVKSLPIIVEYNLDK